MSHYMIILCHTSLQSNTITNKSFAEFNFEDSITQYNDLINKVNTYQQSEEVQKLTKEDKENSESLNKLQKEKIKYRRSEGIPDNSNWITEEGFFITNITLKLARQLAKSVKQNAIVFGRVGERAQLIWLV